ncbi:DUF6207 family protein [Streptomyces sp. NPDC050264]|uniref:DUF6207 family protein n=1 Tax=Streptomyces sp. NPDC050264 TaxID=3155038 RepID=UPI0034391F4C
MTTHLEQPGLVRLTIEGTDTQAVLALAYELTACHNLTGPSTPQPIPGEPGMRAVQYGYPAVMPYE